MIRMNYPSGRTVSYNYDQAGRLADKDDTDPAFRGNLGDGTTRTYSQGIAYSPLGGMTVEKFGTATPIFNKLFYNSRGQLAEIRESTSYASTSDTTWNRGAIINHYSDTCWGMCGGSNSTTTMTDNNGNLQKQEVYIPNNDALPTTSSTTWYQQYSYDALNRLQRVHEFTGNSTTEWQQEYSYDRYGNRTINGATDKTFGNGVNSAQMSVSTATNRMYVAGETDASHSQVDYDAGGNQTKDLTATTGAGTRVFDAENRMTMAKDQNNYTIATYSYEGDGRRVKRLVNGQPSAVETWQVYDLGGELLAEYAANASPASPQKEYGYRRGQLLITAEPTPSGSTNLALNKTATQSSTGWNAPASPAVDGNSDGDWNHNSMSHTLLDTQAWWQVDLGSVQAVSGVEVWNRTDSFPERLTNFNVILLDGNQSVVSTVNVPGQSGTPTTVAISGMARYVKVQFVGTNYLALAEVKVLGGSAYNAAADFTAAQNSGLWSYGYRATGGAFTLDTSNANIFGTGTNSWSQSNISWCCPSITKNTTGATLTYSNIVQPVDMLNLHPGTQWRTGGGTLDGPGGGKLPDNRTF